MRAAQPRSPICLIETLCITERRALSDDEQAAPMRQRLTERLQTRIRKRERLSRETIQNLHRHGGLASDDATTVLLGAGLGALLGGAARGSAVVKSPA
ncbi:MAG: hypothetical protein QF921_12955 [Pseudomonadales bacterium]|nr:hypothetical protein [Pseudomonadales bacterium]MDP6470266.1 hypothetical protein [Pseudomonadales bacterium]MDP6972397.1 hypothetical protein [Pseudomonadales bacterium]